MKTKEFEKCLERGKIKIFSKAKQLVSKELDLAKEDLKIAEDSFAQKKLQMEHNPNLLFNVSYSQSFDL